MAAEEFNYEVIVPGVPDELAMFAGNTDFHETEEKGNLN